MEVSWVVKSVHTESAVKRHGITTRRTIVTCLIITHTDNALSLADMATRCTSVTLTEIAMWFIERLKATLYTFKSLWRTIRSLYNNYSYQITEQIQFSFCIFAAYCCYAGPVSCMSHTTRHTDIHTRDVCIYTCPESRTCLQKLNAEDPVWFSDIWFIHAEIQSACT